MELGTRTVLLLALQTGPGFGLDLIDRVRERSSGRVRLNRGGVYLALRALEAGGLVRSWRPGAARVGRPRRYYELTSSGISAAEKDAAALRGLVESGGPARADLSRMADRFLRSRDVWLFAARIREAGRRAGL